MVFAIAALVSAACAQQADYRKPPQKIVSAIEEAVPPDLSVSPDGRLAVLVQRASYLSVATLSKPVLRLAGMSVDPQTNGPARPTPIASIEVLDLATGRDKPVSVPPDVVPYEVRWSPDGRRCAVLGVRARSIAIGFFEVNDRVLSFLPIRLSAAFASPLSWMPDSCHLVVSLVPKGTRTPPQPAADSGPIVKDAGARGAVQATMRAYLTDALSERRFAYYGASQPALLDSRTGVAKPFTHPGIVAVSPSPDGTLVLVREVVRPYAYRTYHPSFPAKVRVVDLRTGRETPIASQPTGEGLPRYGVIKGPRRIEWKPNEPSTLCWIEALDGGDPKARPEFRDRLVAMDVRTGKQRVLASLKERFDEIAWGRSGDRAVVSEFDFDRRQTSRFYVDRASGEAPLPLGEFNERDLYGDPGDLLMDRLPSGRLVLRQSGEWIYLKGAGASPTGERPFLDRLSLRTRKKERLWASDDAHAESVVAMLGGDAPRFVTLRESATEYPNYYVRSLNDTPAASLRQVTYRRSPNPELLGVTKRLVKYKRPDGVDLSFVLYLPSGYQAGQRLPAIAHAYPREYEDASTAGQVGGSPNRYPRLEGSQLFVLAGYAVMDEVSMPIVGPRATVNDTFVEQLCADADAAVRAAEETGAIDGRRVGVVGHSYGAFMVANLMAHGDAFVAGCAESGAYNRTLTPFGFQSERRSYWGAPETYARMSPFIYADRLKKPLLLIHGLQDNNPGTDTIQSERMFQALDGNGGVCRLVLLPYEEHAYEGLQSVEHVFWEQLRWFDRYVKEAPAVGGGAK